jgi:hypothetical protein
VGTIIEAMVLLDNSNTPLLLNRKSVDASQLHVEAVHIYNVMDGRTASLFSPYNMTSGWGSNEATQIGRI